MSNSIVNPLYPKPSWVANIAVPGQTLAVTSTAAVQVATAFAESTTCVMFDVKTGSVNVTVDGTTPTTTTTGHTLAAGGSWTWSKSMASQAKFIAVSTTASIYFSELQV